MCFPETLSQWKLYAKVLQRNKLTRGHAGTSQRNHQIELKKR